MKRIKTIFSFQNHIKTRIKFYSSLKLNVQVLYKEDELKRISNNNQKQTRVANEKEMERKNQNDIEEKLQQDQTVLEMKDWNSVKDRRAEYSAEKIHENFGSVNHYHEIHQIIKKPFREMGWDTDSLLKLHLSQHRTKDAISILNQLCVNNNENNTPGILDSQRIAACLSGFLANQEIQQDFPQSKFNVLDQFLQFMYQVNRRIQIEMHELIPALQMVGLHHPWKTLFDSWRENNVNMIGFEQDEKKRKMFMLTCNAFANCFAEKGDLASVVYITKLVFILGIHHQSKHLFQSQIKASGRSLGRFSPVMSLKQMENKGYPICGETMAIFMQSMVDSGRYHAVYAIYKQLQASPARHEFGIVNCTEMYESMLETLIKESNLALLDSCDELIDKPEFEIYQKHLDLILKRYHIEKLELVKCRKNRFSKSPFTKYACTMYKYICKEMRIHKVQVTPRIVMFQLLYGMMHSCPIIYYQVMDMIKDGKVEWKRSDYQEWKMIDLIYRKWSRVI